MSTPADHKTAAETLIAQVTAASNGSGLTPRSADFDIIAAHADLARATGSGTHYAAAEAELATASGAAQSGNGDLTYTMHARLARAHAQLADR